MKTTTLTRFGSYGFLSLMMAAQLAVGEDASTRAEKADKAWRETKKGARAVGSDVKKTARDATGNGSHVEDARDEMEDTAENVKDDARHFQKKAERRAD